jgi:NADH-quinone oxidoreductase subunit K
VYNRFRILTENYSMELVHFVFVSTVLFLLGIWGIFLNRKNVIIMLMSIELMLLAINLNLVFFSVYLDDILGQIFALLVLTVAGAESAIGLALLVIYYRIRGTIDVEYINILKG